MSSGTDTRVELGEFLASRRARITPDQVGLPVYDAGKRRVPGLRRGEVATLAGLSVDYYTQLERGKAARRLGVRARRDRPRPAARRSRALPPGRPAPQRHHQPRSGPGHGPGGPPPSARCCRRLLDALTVPAMVGNARQDLVTANALGYAFYAPLYPDPERPDPTVPVNFARFCFLDPAAHEFYPDWDFMADVMVNNLRTEAGRDPYDRDLSDLVGELSTRSEEFRVRWAKHNVRLHRTGTKRFHHPVVGDLEVGYETLPLPADPGLALTVYSPEPATPSADAMSLLASWTATRPTPANEYDDVSR